MNLQRQTDLRSGILVRSKVPAPFPGGEVVQQVIAGSGRRARSGRVSATAEDVGPRVDGDDGFEGGGAAFSFLVTLLFFIKKKKKKETPGGLKEGGGGECRKGGSGQ